MAHPRTRFAKGEPPKSIYTINVLTNKDTKQSRQKRITNEHPYKGSSVFTTHNS